MYKTKIDALGYSFEGNDVFLSNKYLENEETLMIIKHPLIVKEDEPTFAKLINYDFHNGLIEVDVYSKLLNDAPEYARGFIGVTFRIDEHNSNFEGIYIRATNGSSNIQLRRNRATQYFSYPHYKYDLLRQQSASEYESYVDIDIKEWIHMKIEIKDSYAALFINEVDKPCLIVNDLKHGKNNVGSIGLWVDIGTEDYFKNLKISQ